MTDAVEPTATLSEIIDEEWKKGKRNERATWYEHYIHNGQFYIDDMLRFTAICLQRYRCSLAKQVENEIELIQRIADWHRKRYPYFEALELQTRLEKLQIKLSEETGEVAAAVNGKGDLRMEIADTMIVCYQLLREMGTRPSYEIDRAMKKNEERLALLKSEKAEVE